MGCLGLLSLERGTCSVRLPTTKSLLPSVFFTPATVAAGPPSTRVLPSTATAMSPEDAAPAASAGANIVYGSEPIVKTDGFSRSTPVGPGRFRVAVPIMWISGPAAEMGVLDIVMAEPPEVKVCEASTMPAADGSRVIEVEAKAEARGMGDMKSEGIEEIDPVRVNSIDDGSRAGGSGGVCRIVDFVR